jgi:DNA replicative helicase MCM subunit Mcm2 (Cdc46/Mcm family)
MKKSSPRRRNTAFFCDDCLHTLTQQQMNYAHRAVYTTTHRCKNGGHRSMTGWQVPGVLLP